MNQNLSLAKQSILFSMPILLSGVINSIGSFVAMFLIARLGQEALAAGAIIYSTYAVFMTLTLALLIPVSIMIARAFGGKNHNQIRKTLWTGMGIATFVAVFFMVIFYYLYPILLFFKQPALISKLSSDYFYGILFSVLPFMWQTCFMQFTNGVSRPRASLYFSILSIPLTIALGYGMLFGKWGLPALGIIGYAYARTIVTWLTFIIYLIYLRTEPYYKSFNLFQLANTWSWHHCKQLLHLAWPIALQRGGEVMAATVLTFIIGNMGSTVLAAQQIVLQYSLITMIIAFSFAQSAGILVGQNLGANNPVAAKHVGIINIWLGLSVMAIFSLLFVFTPTPLIALFININDKTLSQTLILAKYLLVIAAIMQLFDCARNIAIGILRGYYETRVSLISGVGTCWIAGLPLAYFLGIKMHYGPIGLSLGYCVGIAIGAVIVLACFLHKSSLAISSLREKKREDDLSYSPT